MDPLEGKVARILSERDVVINIGSDQGVQKGMVFKILDPVGRDIKDPDSRKLLGSVEIVKIEVKVVSVQPKLSVARTFHSTVIPAQRGNANGAIAGLSAIANLSARVLADVDRPERVIYETLRVPEDQSMEFSEDDSLVKVGDPAVLVSSSN